MTVSIMLSKLKDRSICFNCKFCVCNYSIDPMIKEDVAVIDLQATQCRKNPPRASNGGYAVFPIVNPEYWCGSFRQRAGA